MSRSIYWIKSCYSLSKRVDPKLNKSAINAGIMYVAFPVAYA